MSLWQFIMSVTLLVLLALAGLPAATAAAKDSWQIGTPIVTYFFGPPMTDATAKQIADAGFNVVWCTESELDLVQKYGMRGMIFMGDFLSPHVLTSPESFARLDALIDRVKDHPAMYAYYICDEPSVSQFPELGTIVAHIRKRDPKHVAYINLFPTYASNAQLGCTGDTVTAYQEYLRQYLTTVKPNLLSYDHYHFSQGENRIQHKQYFLNMGMIRRAALEAGVPWMNIIQGCTWTKEMRAPNAGELRWLHYTSLAYGAQALSYFVYWYQGFYDELTATGMLPEKVGMLYRPDGTLTPQYLAAKELNPHFVAVATQLSSLRSLGAYHVGTVPQGAESLPVHASVTLDFTGSPTRLPDAGMLLGCFGTPGTHGHAARVTHVLVVNLDYTTTISTTVVGPKKMDLFDAMTRTWRHARSRRVALTLSPGGGILVRISTDR